MKTHPGAFPQTRTTCIQRGTSGNAATPASCTLCLKVKDDKKIIPLKKNGCLYGPRSVYSSGSVNFPFTGENKKKGRKTLIFILGKWFKYGSGWFISYIFVFFFLIGFYLMVYFNENTIVSLKISSSR